MIHTALKQEANEKGIILHDGSIYVNFNGEHYLIIENESEFLGRNKIDILIKLRTKKRLNEKDYSKIEKVFPQKKEPEQELKKSISMQLSWLDFAEQFVEERGLFYDENKIWWLWNEKEYCWNMVDETDVMNLCDDALDQTNTTRSGTKQEIIEALKRKGRLFKPTTPEKNWIQFKDTIIDMENLKTFKATKEYLFANPLDWKVGTSEETPILDQLFTDWVGEKHKKTLYEIIAFSISSEYFLHNIICLTGSGSNGKSTFLQILAKFIGLKNITSTDLEALSKSRFETAKLYKKLLALMGETNFSLLSNTSLMKRLTGEDLIGYEFKNKNPFDAYNTAKLVIATNTLPQTTDRTRGFYRRWMIIDFPNEFENKRDILSEVPEEEFENLARKTIGILRELIINRKFTYEGTLDEKQKVYEDKSNPLVGFIKESCKKDFDAEIPLYVLYDTFLTYLSQRRLRKQTKREFSASLKEEGFETTNKTVYKDDGSHTRWAYVIGLKLNDKELFSEFEVKTDNTLNT